MTIERVSIQLSPTQVYRPGDAAVLFAAYGRQSRRSQLDISIHFAPWKADLDEHNKLKSRVSPQLSTILRMISWLVTVMRRGSIRGPPSCLKGMEMAFSLISIRPGSGQWSSWPCIGVFGFSFMIHDHVHLSASSCQNSSQAPHSLFLMPLGRLIEPILPACLCNHRP